MGLTGVVLTVTLRLQQENELHQQKAISKIYMPFSIILSNTVITRIHGFDRRLSKGDNLGRSILMLVSMRYPSDLNAQQAKQPLQLHSSKQIDVPFMFPAFALNELSIKAFNFL